MKTKSNAVGKRIRIESGTRNPSIEALIAIAEKPEMTALALMTDDQHALCPVCGRGRTDEQGASPGGQHREKPRGMARLPLGMKVTRTVG